jgi:hypothetical protein
LKNGGNGFIRRVCSFPHGFKYFQGFWRIFFFSRQIPPLFTTMNTLLHHNEPHWVETRWGKAKTVMELTTNLIKKNLNDISMLYFFKYLQRKSIIKNSCRFYMNPVYVSIGPNWVCMVWYGLFFLCVLVLKEGLCTNSG